METQNEATKRAPTVLTIQPCFAYDECYKDCILLFMSSTNQKIKKFLIAEQAQRWFGSSLTANTLTCPQYPLPCD
jgi:hypothetical protein